MSCPHPQLSCQTRCTHWWRIEILSPRKPSIVASSAISQRTCVTMLWPWCDLHGSNLQLNVCLCPWMRILSKICETEQLNYTPAVYNTFMYTVAARGCLPPGGNVCVAPSPGSRQSDRHLVFLWLQRWHRCGLWKQYAKLGCDYLMQRINCNYQKEDCYSLSARVSVFEQSNVLCILQ